MRTAEFKLLVGQEGVEQLKNELDGLKKQGSSVFANLPKDLQKDLRKAGEAMRESVKDALTSTVKAGASAITDPARSTFAGVLDAANRYRRDITALQISTGRGFEDINKQVQKTAAGIGEMPASTTAWAREVRRLSGDFRAGLDVIGSYKDRAVQLDRPLEAMADQAGRLAAAFGMKSADGVDRFFGRMDAQARKAGISVGALDRQWRTFEEAYARMTSKDPGTLSALSATFAASSSNPEQAQRNQAFGMGLLNQGVRVVEHRMQRAGFGKNFSITDEKTGEVDPKKYVQALRFMQKDMLRFYGSRRRAIEVEAGEDMGARRDVAGFLNTDLSKVDDLSQLPPEKRRAMEAWLKTGAGKREQDESKKNIKDIELGKRMLPAQDKMVEMGGGAAGLAMDAASGVFSTAVDKFGGIIGGFAGKALTVVAALGGAGYAGYKAGQWIDGKTGASDKIAGLLSPSGSIPMTPDVTPIPASVFEPPKQAAPMSVSLDSKAADSIGKAVAQNLADKVLQTQSVTPAGPPPIMSGGD